MCRSFAHEFHSIQGFQVGPVSEETMFFLLLPFLPVVLGLASPFLHGQCVQDDDSTQNDHVSVSPAAPMPTSAPLSNFDTNCFPAIGFKAPSEMPTSIEGWWCHPATEYAFIGFSYEVTACACAIFDKLMPLTRSMNRSEPRPTTERVFGYSQ